MVKRYLHCCIFYAMMFPLTAQANLTRISPLERALILKGRNGTGAFVFETPLEADLQLHLLLRSSEIIDNDHSSLTVEVDHQPIRTVWLKDILSQDGVQALSVDLRNSTAGVHFVRIIARLHVEDDPCLHRHGGMLGFKFFLKVKCPGLLKKRLLTLNGISEH